MAIKHKVEFVRSGKTIEIEEGQKILEAGLRAGLNLPYGCTSGSCSACSSKVKGVVFLTNSKKEIVADNNYITLCVATPKGDLVIQA